MEVRAQPKAVCVSRENPAHVLVCFEEGPPALLDLAKGTSRPVPYIPVGQPPPPFKLQPGSNQSTEVSTNPWTLHKCSAICSRVPALKIGPHNNSIVYAPDTDPAQSGCIPPQSTDLCRRIKPMVRRCQSLQQ